jgi:hypothetical protein
MTDICRFDFSAALVCSLALQCMPLRRECKLPARMADRQNHLLSHDGKCFFCELRNAGADDYTGVFGLFQRKNFLLFERANCGLTVDIPQPRSFLRKRNKLQRAFDC